VASSAAPVVVTVEVGAAAGVAAPVAEAGILLPLEA
jgi:hypothetical protein